MNETPTPGQLQATAVALGFSALVRTLSEAGVLPMDAFIGHLAKIQTSLQSTGDEEVSELLGGLADMFQAF